VCVCVYNLTSVVCEIGKFVRVRKRAPEQSSNLPRSKTVFIIYDYIYKFFFFDDDDGGKGRARNYYRVVRPKLDGPKNMG